MKYSRLTPTQRVWYGMKSRCQSLNHSSYHRYGGRGIRVCERWQTYKNFLADMGERPPGMSLDRIDNNGNYEPSNCRWATREQQNNNTRKSHFITVGDSTYSIAQWARILGVNRSTIHKRISRSKWNPADALIPPIPAGERWEYDENR